MSEQKKNILPFGMGKGVEKSILITGGSTGIGYQISRKFAAAGFKLLWVSESQEDLDRAKVNFHKEFPNVEVLTLLQDLTEENGAQNVLIWVLEQKLSLDILVNNAGFGTYGFLQETDYQKELKMIQLNIVNVYKMSRLFLEHMMLKNSGTIINISSISALMPITRLNTYASTKSFVKHFSQGLQEELLLQKSKVKVLTVCPAALKDTPFKTRGSMEDVKTFDGLVTTTSLEVAADVYKSYQKGRTFVISGKKARMLNPLNKIMPASIRRYLVNNESQRVLKK